MHSWSEHRSKPIIQRSPTCPGLSRVYAKLHVASASATMMRATRSLARVVFLADFLDYGGAGGRLGASTRRVHQ